MLGSIGGGGDNVDKPELKVPGQAWHQHRAYLAPRTRYSHTHITYLSVVVSPEGGLHRQHRSTARSIASRAYLENPCLKFEGKTPQFSAELLDEN